jgi:CHASE2 domain-containing sensor protein
VWKGQGVCHKAIAQPQEQVPSVTVAPPPEQLASRQPKMAPHKGDRSILSIRDTNPTRCRTVSQSPSKLAVLKLGEGDLTTGLSVILQIGDDQARPDIELRGQLDPNPRLLEALTRWETQYQNLDFQGRPLGKPGQVTSPTSRRADCQAAAQTLGTELNQWLQGEGFRPLREKWLASLPTAIDLRVILQTADRPLQKLPWHQWDLLQTYPQAELGLASPSYDRAPIDHSPTSQVKILALLGDSQGLDLQQDQALLQALPDAAVTFLVEPSRSQLLDNLWEKPWDIFFFAGHSQSSQGPGQFGINPEESLSLEELRYGLQKAVAKGLKLAMFNSCDGLGLAQTFADLHIPQLIVMRQAVPDRVAAQFLQYFLAAYAQGAPLYSAVRQGRERLESLEDRFPCATWLPIIFQNLSAPALSWNDLLGRSLLPQRRALKGWPWLIPAAGLVAALLTSGVRALGLLQTPELMVYDQMLRWRPQEPSDSRIVVITVTEADVKAQAEGRGSLSDRAFDQLLTKLEALQPAVIGLDIYRDFPVGKGFPKLAQRLKRSDRLVAVCRSNDIASKLQGIAPPPEVSSDRLGFSNFVVDPDHVVRRQLLALEPAPDSPCTADYGLSSQLALRYLDKQGVKLAVSSQGVWRLGKAKFAPLEPHHGGYQAIDAWGYQVMLNYRNYRDPAEVAPRITLQQALSGSLTAAAIKDRIVLIGTTAESFQDFTLTPFRNAQGHQHPIPGVMMQAQMVSQLLSAALEGRSLIRSLPPLVDGLCLMLGGTMGAVVLVLRSRFGPGVSLLGALVLVGGVWTLGFWGLAGPGLWLPVVPTLLAAGLGGGLLLSYDHKIHPRKQP